MGYLDLAIPEDEDLDQVLPAGDLSIFADLGLDEMDLGMIAGDLTCSPTRRSRSSRASSGSARPTSARSPWPWAASLSRARPVARPACAGGPGGRRRWSR